MALTRLSMRINLITRSEQRFISVDCVDLISVDGANLFSVDGLDKVVDEKEEVEESGCGLGVP